MDANQYCLLAIDPQGWLFRTDLVGSSTLILLTLLGLVLLVGVLYWSGVITRALSVAGVLIRGGIGAGFRAWERLLAWASWPVFLSVQLGLLAVGIVAAGSLPALGVGLSLVALAMGLVACLAYMFIDVERYEVARGYKALHNPLKGQRLALELARYGHKVGVPLLAAAALGMIGGFALLNFGLFRIAGTAWYTQPAADATYLDFIASALVHLLSVVDLLNLADANRLVQVAVARPVSGVASALLTLFKSFFTLVLLQQIFASVRKGRLLAETIADFWSPHEPIHERARAALPQYGAVALSPLLVSLPAAETLTREQREQLPRILATIGPAAIPDLIRHLEDANEHIRAVAVATLGRLHAANALPQLVRLAHDPSHIVRLSLVEALGDIGGSSTTSAARSGIRVKPSVRRLFRSRVPKPPPVDPIAIVMPVLRSALSDPSAAIRAEAATSLGRMGGPARPSIADLTQLLADRTRRFVSARQSRWAW